MSHSLSSGLCGHNTLSQPRIGTSHASICQYNYASSTVRPSTRQFTSLGNRRPTSVTATAAAPVAPPSPIKRSGDGHSALLQGLGAVGDVPPALMPWLLRLSHVNAHTAGSDGASSGGGDSAAALQLAARGALLWKAALERGLTPDDSALSQLVSEKDSFVSGQNIEDLRWPEEPLRGVLVRTISTLGVARFAQRYSAVRDALLKGVLELIVKYHKTVNGEVEVEERAVDAYGNKFLTAKELAEEEAQRRAALAKARGSDVQGTPVVRNPNIIPQQPQPQKQQATATATATAATATSTDNEDNEAELEAAEERASWSPERRIAEDLCSALYTQWRRPVETLSRAGRAFSGLEGLLAGAGFDLNGSVWSRRGWAEMDKMREKLEDIKELRDLVRSLGRGGGWGPLRRAPVQRLDMRGRAGLLRTTLEAQETRGLTRSDDISRLLPSEAAMLARGRTVRQAKLMFYAKHAEKALQTYERDGWGEFPTQVHPDRREIRPTADRGPILLCVDTSGSMRGAREVVAKALALECMRAAQAQERGCFVYAFSGPQEVRELELNMDAKSISNLLDFLEKTFNGGSDFNAPVQRCLDRLAESKWANSDILLVSDGELRQPGPEIMRKLSGAKDKLSLRVHGLIVGSPEQKRADPAVLRGLCSHVLPSGKAEVLVHEFESWASVQADRSMKFDWDDAAGNAARREAGMRLEKMRQAEMKRRRVAGRGVLSGGSGGGGSAKAKRMPGKNTSTFE